MKLTIMRTTLFVLLSGVACSLQAEKINLHTEEVDAVIQILDAIFQAIPQEQRAKFEKIPDVVKRGSMSLRRTQALLNELDQFKERGELLRKQMLCIAGKSCSVPGCTDKRACIAQTLKNVKALLKPIIENVLGKIELNAEGKPMITESGILLLMSDAQVIPEDKRKLIVTRLSDLTSKIDQVIRYLDLLGFIINPQLEIPTGVTAAQATAIKSEPIPLAPVDEDEFMIIEEEFEAEDMGTVSKYDELEA